MRLVITKQRELEFVCGEGKPKNIPIGDTRGIPIDEVIDIVKEQAKEYGFEVFDQRHLVPTYLFAVLSNPATPGENTC